MCVCVCLLLLHPVLRSYPQSNHKQSTAFTHCVALIMFQPVAQGQDEGGGVGRVDIDVDMISFTKMDSTQVKVMYNVGIDLKT